MQPHLRGKFEYDVEEAFCGRKIAHKIDISKVGQLISEVKNLFILPVHKKEVLNKINKFNRYKY